MDSRFESIKNEEELDNLGHSCIICRDQMDLLGGCKKLPGCGHAFHKHCLREWLVQQQTCPTCRSDIVANEARRKKKLEQERAAAAVDNRATERRIAVDAENSAAPEAIIMSVEAGSSTMSPSFSDTKASQSIMLSPLHLNQNTKSPQLELGPPHFPCLYQITLQSGAPVFSSIDSSEHSQKVARVISQGKLVVSTSLEYWPSPFEEAMLCIPDGYVRLRDVERFLILSSHNT
jgi:E3 ubiquitin-protein ligase synoviolin